MTNIQTRPDQSLQKSNGGEIEDLSVALNYGARLSGVTLSLEDSYFILEFITKVKPSLTVKQLSEAFESYASGSLFQRDELKLYGKLSAKDVLRIIKKSEEVNQPKQKRLPVAAKIYTKEQIEAGKKHLDESIIREFEKYKSGQNFEFLILTPVIIRLQNCGFTLSEPDPENVLQAAMKSLLMKKNLNHYTAKHIKKEAEKNDRVKARMRVSKGELQIRDIFKDLINRNEHIKNHLKEN